ncbi:tetratricopeptide repeat protein, partial [bacterium]|nr:tetratricopeptide repeat protein [bacterium]
MGQLCLAEENKKTQDYYYNMHGLLFTEQKNYPEALKNFSSAIKENASNPDSYFNRGIVYYNLKQYDLAETDFLKTLELKPNNPIAYNYLGLINAMDEDYATAIQYYSKALETSNKPAHIYYNRG